MGNSCAIASILCADAAQQERWPQLISVAQKQMLSWIGLSLLQLQSTETVIQFCLTHVLPKTSNLTWAMLDNRKQYLRNKTVGYLLHELRTRVEIHPHFEEVLTKFLGMRNTFVHNVQETPGWSLDSDQGISIAGAFVRELIRLNEIVQVVFLGLISAWQDENTLHVEAQGMPEKAYAFASGEINML
jgi:hypothetical protein